jgi:hypothetical protein
MISEQDLQGFERLRSSKAMKEYYSIKENDKSGEPVEEQSFSPDDQEEITQEVIENKHVRSFQQKQNRDFRLEYAEKLINLEKKVRVCGLDFTMEILKQNMGTSKQWFILPNLISFIMVFVPLLVNWIFGETFFQCNYHRDAFLCSRLTIFVKVFSNILSAGTLLKFFNQKLRFKQAVLSSLDQELKNKFSCSTSANLPKISSSSPSNLRSAVLMAQILHHIHNHAIKRSKVSLTVIFVGSSLQYLYICV